MSRKAKYSANQKTIACEDFISGRKSAQQIAHELNMGKHGKIHVRTWAKVYKKYGVSAFCNEKNGSYSREFKINVVNEYLSGKGSLRDLSIKYNIPSNSTLSSWIKMYNNHMELKDYSPKSEVYMADTLKTTYEERIEIVKYCLSHDRDIKGTAAKYGCKYAQLYQWVRKYEVNGEESLIDKRGKRKNEVELTDLEKYERKITQLEREKEEYRKKYELLKKAEERERW